MTHTPTPWKIRDDFGGGWIQGSPAEGETYGDRVASLAKPRTIGASNAALIVKAVNSHDALMKALEQIRDDMLCDPKQVAIDALVLVGQPDLTHK